MTEESQESLESVVEVARLYIPGSIQACKFFIALNERMLKDTRQRTSFERYVIHVCRIAVLRLSNLSPAEIANRLRVSVKTVYNDLAWHLQQQQKKKVKRRSADRSSRP